MFDMKKTYKFYTLAPEILGSKYDNMTVKGIMDYTDALKISDVVTTHDKLSSLTDVDVTDLTFIKFENLEGEIVTFAEQWINANSVELVESIDISAKIYNVSTEDLTIINNSLKELGYTNVVITTI